MQNYRYAVMDSSILLCRASIIDDLLRCGWRPVILSKVLGEINCIKEKRSDVSSKAAEILGIIEKYKQTNSIDIVNYENKNVGKKKKKKVSGVDILLFVYAKKLMKREEEVILFTRDLALYTLAKNEGVPVIELKELNRFFAQEIRVT